MKLTFALVLTAWLVSGIVAGGQRGYFGNDQVVNCKTGTDTGLTILAGPLNYAGVHPEAGCPKAPHVSV